jgi:hypothetical protein
MVDRKPGWLRRATSSNGWLLLMVVVALGCSAETEPVVCSRGDPPPSPGGGCGVHGARITVRSPSYELHDPLANPGTLVATWDCGGSVLFEYRSGISMTQAATNLRHPARAFQRMSIDSLDDDAITINGLPAYVASPGPCALGVVTLLRNGLLINVVGDGDISGTDLKRVAATLRPPTD